MPFQSEKQRRYLWANEPEIARDWTDTYGSGIAKALGGRIPFRRGSDRHAGTGGGWSPGVSHSGSPNQGSGSIGGEGPQGPINPHMDTAPVLEQQRKTDFLNEVRRQQAEKDYTRTGQIKLGPQLGLTSTGVGGGLGNFASQFAGSKIGGGLGSMLFGPLGMLLGSLFGRGVGKRGWQARQTPEKETLRDIMLGQNTLLSNLFNKKTPTIGGEGIQTIDIRDKFNRKEPEPINKYEWDTVVDKENPYQDFVTQAGLTSTQKGGLKSKRGNVKGGLMTPEDAWESIKFWDEPDDPSTLEEVKEYLDI